MGFKLRVSCTEHLVLHFIHVKTVTYSAEQDPAAGWQRVLAHSFLLKGVCQLSDCRSERVRLLAAYFDGRRVALQLLLPGPVDVLR